jgi:threonine dehydrogenase-like Zn-dependent dehydrogenase
MQSAELFNSALADVTPRDPHDESSPWAAPLQMHGLVYRGPGRRAWEERPRPVLREPTDAIVSLTTSTICGTDLHILKGDVPSVTEGRILGHEGIGVVTDVGPGVVTFRAGDRVGEVGKAVRRWMGTAPAAQVGRVSGVVVVDHAG